MNSERAFKPPPEAPVVFPTAEQFLDPIAYLSTLQPLLLKYGICKIRPPPVRTSGCMYIASCCAVESVRRVGADTSQLAFLLPCVLIWQSDNM